MTAGAGARLAACAAALVVPVCLTAQTPSLDDVLDRLGAYLADYEVKLTTVAADERFEQRYRTWTGSFNSVDERRTLRSDFIFLRLPGGSAWMGMRDTYEVDGAPSRGKQARLEQMLASADRGAMDEARRIVDGNRRHNLGPVQRTVNVPTQALDMLARQHRSRFKFARTGETRLDGVRVWTISFTEQTRPTMVVTPFGDDVRTRGIAWIDPITGAVRRTQLDFELEDSGEAGLSRIEVRYAHDAALGLLVPEEMTERYSAKLSRFHSFELATKASYKDFRSFQTSARLIPR